MGKIYDYQGNIVSDGIGRGIEYNVRGVCHRGYNYSTCSSGTFVVNNSDGAPENTLPAYKLAAQKGFKYVECDVAFTSDGEAVLLHDDTINRTSNGTGAIASLTLAQAQSYIYNKIKYSGVDETVPGYDSVTIPTFEDFIKLCKNLSLHPYIELKGGSSYTEAQIQGIVDMVDAAGMKGKVTYISFNPTYLGYVKDYDEEARLGFVVFDVSSSPSPGLTQANIDVAKALRTGKNDVFMDCRARTDAACTLCINNEISLETWGIAVVTEDTEANILALNPYFTGVTSNKYDAGKVLYDDAIE